MSTPMPDFLHPVRGTHPLAWAACAAASAVLAVALLDAREAWQAREQALAAHERRLAADIARPVRPAASAAFDPAQAAARKATSLAVQRLQRPWPQAFRAIEAIDVPGLTWLALDLTENGTLRLEGQAADAQAAMAAAQALRRQGLWPDVVLGRMERAEGGMLRFELTGAGATLLAGAGR